MRHDCGVQTPVDIPNRPQQHVVLASESAAEFARIRRLWYGEYSPSDMLEHEFVERAKQASRSWTMQRGLELLDVHARAKYFDLRRCGRAFALLGRHE